MTPSLVNRWFAPFMVSAFLLLSGVSTGVGADGADRVKRVEAATHSGVQFSSLAIHPSGKKLFAGQAHVGNPQESGLWVFDIDKLGDLTSTDERSYPVLPSGSKPDARVIYYGAAFSPDGRKLYLALGSRVDKKPLAVYDLDEKGEPVGKVRTYANGNPESWIWQVLPHPGGSVLYTVGEGGVFSLPLAKGEPSGEPSLVSAPNGSIVLSEQNDVLIAGGYPSIIKTLDVGSDGTLEKPLPTEKPYQASKCQMYLRIQRIGHCLFFENESVVFSWPLDRAWQPAGKQPRRFPEFRPCQKSMNGQIATADGSLYVAADETVTDPAPTKTRAKGFRVLEFKPNDQGELRKPVFESPLIENAACTGLAVSPKTGIIYISY